MLIAAIRDLQWRKRRFLIAVVGTAFVFAPVFLAAGALVLFVVVVQPSASVLRAAVMGAIALLAVLSGRRRQAIPVLSASVIALMIAAPQLAVDVGFALSVSATAALVVLAPAWSARLTARGVPKPLADGICIALAAQLVTAPLVAAISGRLSLVGVLANLAVAVVIPPITLLGTAAAALCPVWPSAARLFIRFTGPELWWLLRVADTGAALPAAAVPVPSGWAGLVLVGGATVVAAALWRRRWFRLAGAGGLLGLVEARKTAHRHPALARDIESLWFMRGDLLLALAMMHGELVARHRVESLREMFEGLIPEALNSRPSPLEDI